MRRLVLTSLAFAALAVVQAGPALAFQCPKLIGEINTATANRYDPGAAGAKQKAAEATKLHADGKHAESEKAAREGLAMIGIQK
jgi:hypothetical protein